MASRIISRLEPRTTGLLLCDMQEKYRSTVQHFESIVAVSNRMLRAARLLDIPVLATEHLAKGADHTVPELGLKEHDVPLFNGKTTFSIINEEVREYLKREIPSVDAFMLCGIETHQCIYQTAADLLEGGYHVHLIVDAISSRTQANRFFAFRQLENFGAQLTTSESALFDLLRDSDHPKFQEIQKIIEEPAPDSDLVSFK